MGKDQDQRRQPPPVSFRLSEEARALLRETADALTEARPRHTMTDVLELAIREFCQKTLAKLRKKG